MQEAVRRVHLDSFSLFFASLYNFPISSASYVTYNLGCKLQTDIGCGTVTAQEASSALEIAVTTTPLPATLPLLATGLGALGLLGWRRKRKALAARKRA